MIAATSDIEFEYGVLLKEMEAYNPELIDRPRCVVITKMDLLPGYELEKAPSLPGEEVFYISAATGRGLEELKQRVWEKLKGGNGTA
jgi:GTP-binding protein